MYNYIAMGIIGLIAFVIAYGLVGKLYDNDIIEGASIGSILHWIIRLIVCSVLFLAVSFVIWLVKAIISIPLYIWIIISGIIVLGFLTSIIVKVRSHNTGRIM
jgi:hypothetical protein